MRTLKKRMLDVYYIIRSEFYKLKCKNVSFSEKVILFSKASIANSKVGRYTYFAGFADVSNADIGSFCSIAKDVIIGMGKHPISYFSTSPALFSDKTILPHRLLPFDSDYKDFEKVIIKDDVWCGRGCMILDGVTIGQGAIIAAGAVVTKDVMPYTIVAGCPARVISSRFSDENIQYLMSINYSILSVDEIIILAKKFNCHDNKSV
ncbi:CatB-related O-acetyltransferase [Shewanella baltica]|jgi:acetyltransferase-like isoleucine patch superfamily enzyme|uniref:CatB-related O-acetyltransferase n=1 Tax=Shewanella baltica TaxID=62322 RepID=UPI00217E2C16|nr:CatB-related O-acetyltransferase [Shewanella baltica]MCS6180477.1 CatB-related O-acetyltransferase [Shewanella baltica]MCS6256701.1 CatB-related O-acetyltransferase [Shewanella baltica]